MKKKNQKKTEEKSFTVSLSLGDKIYTGYGENTLSALRSIVPPIKIFTKGTITVTDGQKQMKQTWMPVKLKRLFYPLSQPVLAKQLTYLMK